MQTLTTTTKDPQALATITAAPSRAQCFQSHVPDYALLFFDHLYSEYLTLKPKITDSNAIVLFDSLHEKRLNCELTWSDIYTFDLALVDQRPLENLIRKGYDTRAKYRSIAGQKEFDEYLASKPPDLTTILVIPNKLPAAPDQPANPLALAPPPDDPPPPAPPAPPNSMPQSEELIQRVLRADIRYLLSKFYLYYAMLPMRESYREDLTRRAVRMTKWILGTIAILTIISFGGGLLLKAVAKQNQATLSTLGELLGAFGPVVGSVVFAGIVGGCVSMLQRIQSAPSEGDALFNLAALTNGWRGLSLSPLYGGIFASLLFILFAGGILKGSVFPDIQTVNKSEKSQTAPNNEQPPPADAAATTPAGAESRETPAQVSSRLPDPEKNEVLKVKDFLKETGPKDGVAFALLMIWSFIAGFAERLVPDTLNRLVAKNEALQGTNG
jgi:hypothetical protein